MLFTDINQKAFCNYGDVKKARNIMAVSDSGNTSYLAACRGNQLHV